MNKRLCLIFLALFTGLTFCGCRDGKRDTRIGMDLVEKSWPVWSVAFSPDGRWLAAGRGYRDDGEFWPEGGDGKVNVWSVEGWKQQDGFSAPFSHMAGSIAFTPDGKCLAAAANQSIRVKQDRSIWGMFAAGAPNPWDGNVIFFWTVSNGKLV